MKNFTKSDLSLSLCGLNCMLCSMHISGYCPGCGGGEGNQSCKIARCSMEHGRPEYCNECKEYPCETYEGIDAFDSFITHYNQKKDLEKSREKRRISCGIFWKIITTGGLPPKESAACIAGLLRKMADERQIVLKLRKKR